MGDVNDPKDGKAVAGTIFTAVFVYIVRVSSNARPSTSIIDRRPASKHSQYILIKSGIPHLLRSPGTSTRPRKPKRRDCPIDSTVPSSAVEHAKKRNPAFWDIYVINLKLGGWFRASFGSRKQHFRVRWPGRADRI